MTQRDAHGSTLGRVTVRMCVSSSSRLITLFERLRMPAALGPAEVPWRALAEATAGVL